MNLIAMLEETVRRYPDKTAVALDDRKLSFGKLDEASNKVANALLKMELSKGDRVVILLPNTPELAILYFGIVKAGGIVVPLDIRYKVAELVPLFDNCQPKVLISESSYLEPIAPVLPASPPPRPLAQVARRSLVPPRRH